jgi:hypothetical protein
MQRTRKVPVGKTNLELSDQEFTVIYRHIRISGSHHFWTGAKNSQGYPYFWHQGTAVLLGRFLWQLNNYELMSYQKLRNCPASKGCVNTEHFRLLTSKEAKKLVHRFQAVEKPVRTLAVPVEWKETLTRLQLVRSQPSIVQRRKASCS